MSWSSFEPAIPDFDWFDEDEKAYEESLEEAKK